MNWVNTINNILLNPHNKQTKAKLVEFYKNGKVKGKCAIGEIGCQSGFTPMQLCIMGQHEYSEILDKIKVPKEYTHGKILPNLTIKYDLAKQKSFSDFEEITDEHDKHQYYGVNLQEYIWMLNDRGFKYKEIAEFITTTFGKHDN